MWLVILAGSLTGHAAFVVALNWTEPAPRPAYAAHVQRVTRVPPTVRRPAGEPRRAIVYPHHVRLSEQVTVRSVARLTDEDAARLRQLYERAARLYPFYAGRGRRPGEPLELRLLPFELLNDPTLFSLGGDQRVLGLYYPSRNLIYLTPLALHEPNHVLHELGHHFADVYQLNYGEEYEEVHVHRFTQYVARFERLMRMPHVHRRRPPVMPEWEAAALRTVIDERVVVRSRNLLHPSTKRWLRDKIRLAVTMFGAATGVPEPGRRPLEIRLVDDAALAAAFPSGARRGPAGHYFPRDGVLVTTARALGDTEVLGHYLAHHLIASLPEALDAESVEQLACGFAWDMDRHLQHEVGALGGDLLASGGWADDPARVRTLAVSILQRLGRRSRDDRRGSDPTPR